MQKVFRILLLVLVAVAIYGGFISQVWSYPIGIITFSFICFLGTLNGHGLSKPSKASNNSSVIFGASVTSHSSSGLDCGGTDGGC